MVMGWRMYEDLEKFAEMVNASVKIDLLRKAACTATPHLR